MPSPFKKTLFTVTPLSKTLALLLIVVLPFWGFTKGMEYQKSLTVSPSLTDNMEPNLENIPGPYTYQVSPDRKYVAMLHMGSSLGDESFTLRDFDGNVIKEFGRLNASQSLHPLGWYFGNIFYVSDGIAIDNPTRIISINAETLEIIKYSPQTN